MDTFIMDEQGRCTNKFKFDESLPKIEIHPIVDTMNDNRMIFLPEMILRLLNHYVNAYTMEMNRTDFYEELLAKQDIDADKEYHSYIQKRVIKKEGL